MTHATDILTLTRWLAGDYSNQPQAFENPPFFAHIRVCMRPLPNALLDGLSIYVEQAYDLDVNAPYRVRVLKMVDRDGHIELENYAIADEAELHGASRDRDRLSSLTRDRLTLLPCCNFLVEWKDGKFTGSVEPGKRCMVTRKGQETYLDSTFELSESTFVSWDRGRNPIDDSHVWGSLAGPFQFEKRASFADEVMAL